MKEVGCKAQASGWETGGWWLYFLGWRGGGGRVKGGESQCAEEVGGSQRALLSMGYNEIFHAEYLTRRLVHAQGCYYG